MKTILSLFLLLLLGRPAGAQVITQTDDYTVTFTSQASVELKNKRNCTMTFRIKAYGFTTDISVTALALKAYTQPGGFAPGTVFQIKTVSGCGDNNGPWVDITVPNMAALPLMPDNRVPRPNTRRDSVVYYDVLDGRMLGSDIKLLPAGAYIKAENGERRVVVKLKQ